MRITFRHRENENKRLSQQAVDGSWYRLITDGPPELAYLYDGVALLFCTQRMAPTIKEVRDVDGYWKKIDHKDFEITL